MLLVTDTRAAHALNDGQYARASAAEQAAAELGVASLRDVDPATLDDALARLSDDVLRRRARHVVTEIDRVRSAVAALRQGDLAELGPTVRRVTLVAARRLRGELCRARRLGRRGPRGRGPISPT